MGSSKGGSYSAPTVNVPTSDIAPAQKINYNAFGGRGGWEGLAYMNRTMREQQEKQKAIMSNMQEGIKAGYQSAPVQQNYAPFFMRSLS